MVYLGYIYIYRNQLEWPGHLQIVKGSIVQYAIFFGGFFRLFELLKIIQKFEKFYTFPKV